jgi:hypothetical protein
MMVMCRSRVSLKSCWVVLVGGSTIINFLLVLSSEGTCESLPNYITVQGPIALSISTCIAANCTHFWSDTKNHHDFIFSRRVIPVVGAS